ncbi:hypothetical protein BDV95DRAFT_568507 [Massariosphaeria phaeospora]|uniref:SRR1-like domain-containing protein n=1 Tax=Massariosphaeria phaeospora TaxID=100035 RepID=A0A7C8I826_9PLEO|nr:hypothetical protein BDV95DRAFT_568507 [Massariosphaeria phaeospora]
MSSSKDLLGIYPPPIHFSHHLPVVSLGLISIMSGFDDPDFVPPPPAQIDVAAFLTRLGNRPIFTRALLQHAATQLAKAKHGEAVEMIDCYGAKRRSVGQQHDEPILRYHNFTTLADPEPYNILLHAEEGFRARVLKGCCGFGQTMESLVQHAKFPVYMHFKPRTHQSLPYYDVGRMMDYTNLCMDVWAQCPEREALVASLQGMQHTAQVTNIVCIGHGKLDSSPESVVQHLAALTIAEHLTALYEDASQPLASPITIVAQDPAYSDTDKTVLSLLKPGIAVVDDPAGFLAINEGSLVMSAYPSVPVKQIVADLSAAFPAKGPAAMLWGSSERDDKCGVDVVGVEFWELLYYANPGSPRLMAMLEGFEKLGPVNKGTDSGADTPPEVQHEEATTAAPSSIWTALSTFFAFFRRGIRAAAALGQGHEPETGTEWM